MTAMPAIFFGHGNPMNAIQRNHYTSEWQKVGAFLPTPRAILCVSAHWYGPGTAVTAMGRPPTIHDFGGFPRELYDVEYPAQGDTLFAAEVRDVLQPLDVGLDEREWGLDHGAWSVLVHAFPAADVPVVELRIDDTKPASFHYELGQRLQALRKTGVLVMGSGNVVHNLEAYGWGRRVPEPYDWAQRFEAAARSAIVNGDHKPLIDYEHGGEDAMRSAPTPDHFLPLLYVLGTQFATDIVSFPVDGYDGGSISMLTVQLG
jgi:4,5-DOPA dioxygenase extradiol